MKHLSTSLTLPPGQVDDFAARQRTPPLGRDLLAAGMQSPLWLTLFGSLVILGMLMVFHQVVHDAVQQGQLRHKANAHQTAEMMRCKVLPGRDASDRCLLQLNLLANDNSFTNTPSQQLASQ